MTSDEGELARVIPLHGRHENDLLTRLRESLADRGSVTEDLQPADVLPKLWRTTARKAARDLARPVRTGQVEHDGSDTITVYAVLTDWPATDDEKTLDMATKRRMVTAAALIYPIPPAGPTAAG